MSQRLVLSQGCSNPGLILANAFGVMSSCAKRGQKLVYRQIVSWLIFAISAVGYCDALGFGSRLTVDDDGLPARR